MRLIDNDGIIPAQVAIALGFGQQDAIGHDFYVPVVAGPILKPNFVTYRLAGFLPQFLGNPPGDCCGGYSPGLGASDEAVYPPPSRQAILGQLGGLAGSGLAGYHQDRMLSDGLDNFIFF